MLRWFRVVFLFCLSVMFVLLPVGTRAQSSLTVAASPPDVQAFPSVGLTVRVADTSGNFVDSLEASQVNIVENGQGIAPGSLLPARPGAQYVFAFNPGPPFAIRDAQGKARFNYLVEVFETWAASTGSEDDLSLLFNNGPQKAHMPNPAEWIELLKSANVDLRNATPNWQILSQAINLAAEPGRNPGMGRGVLFVTSNPDNATAPIFENIATLAIQNGVQVSVWMVASSTFFDSPGAAALEKMASDTGGAFFAYSGTETIPNPEAYLERLRSAYRVSYNSLIRGAGPHDLLVEVSTPTGQGSSSPQSFELNILPPQPVLIDPPKQVTRILPDPAATPQVLAPQFQTLEILIDFPDGFERPLQRSALFVDGQLVDENTSPPFDAFQWDISSYTESGRHIVQVEIVDELGLGQLSIEIPIDIDAVRQGSPQAFISSTPTATLIAAGVVLLAGITLVVSLVVAVRTRATTRPLTNRKKPAPVSGDPVYQVITNPEETTTGKLRLAGWASQLQNRLSWPQRAAKTEQPFAYLERLPALGEPESLTPSKPIAIYSAEITVGSDRQQATLVLEDPSVEPLHARLHLDENGVFYLQDQGSLAGTWVNYQAILPGSLGVRLGSGDVVHFGRSGFRFSLPSTTPLRPPVVIRDKQAG